MVAENNERPDHPCIEEVLTNEKLAASGEWYAASRSGNFERDIFGLALALVTEPSKLGQLRRALLCLRGQHTIPEDFAAWAIARIDEQVLSMALEYTHDAEVIVQILSFKAVTFDCLRQDIEDLYQREQITQRVYARAKLLLSRIYEI
ncbi:MAG TPA: hypothetical protein VKV40_21530 [Ktedonobacteraceae bacterium]|nr:hypothetical protein [Ktedonobacteraceae bacterium]